MAHFTLVFLLSFILLTSPVLAGSRIWQPALEARDKKTSKDLQRRYFHVIPDTRVQDRVPWPNKEIRYCWKDSAAEAALKAPLKDARKLWTSKGLGNDFKWTKASAAECANNVADVLTISYTGSGDEANMATFVGFPDANANIRKFAGRGPQMFLTDRTDIGMLDVVANLAHEIGHAWGLYHEHQNPNFWSGVVAANGGKVFGPDNNNWRCENLKDYYKLTQFVVQTGGGGSRTIGVEQACSNYGIALSKQFSAYDYLPIPNAGSPHSNGKDSNAVDWDSLMLYPSGAGGRVDDTIAGDDKRAPILLQADGKRIPVKTGPSTLDISGLNAMYQNEASKLTLLQKTTGSIKKGFQDVFKSSGSGPSGGSGCL